MLERHVVVMAVLTWPGFGSFSPLYQVFSLAQQQWGLAFVIKYTSAGTLSSMTCKPTMLIGNARGSVYGVDFDKTPSCS